MSRNVAAEPGRETAITERLHRPAATLVLSSSPARATLTLNEQTLGPGPRSVSVMRYEHFHVTATLPGYQPWSQTLYIKEATTKVVAQLMSTAKPAARAPARPATHFSR